MKKKLTEILYTTIICVFCVFILSACKRCEHKFGEWVVITAPTCTKDGEQSQTCTKCGITQKESIDALGHKTQTVAAQDATCTDVGWETYEQCIRCNYNTKQEIMALGHEFADEWTSGESGHWHACTHEGCEEKNEEAAHSEVVHNCSVCGVKTSDHEFSKEWLNDGEKHWHVCTHEGCEEKNEEASHNEVNHYCSICNYKMSDHEFGEVTYTWANDYKSCTATRHCLKCSIDTLGHTQTISATITSTVQSATCETPELTTYTAIFVESWASEQIKANIETKAALSHKFGKWIVTTTPTCTKAGEQSQTCTNCGKIQKESIDALGHKTQTVAAQDATCTDVGWETYEQCIRCNYNTKQVITALGHKFADEWTSGESGHWHACTHEGCEEKNEEASHNEVNHYCSICNYKMSDHEFGEVTYTWANDYKSCTATRHCLKCSIDTLGHTQTISATITSTVQSATCETPELTTYTATFTGISYGKEQIKEIETDVALGHDYTGTYKYDFDVHWKTCQRYNCSATTEKVVHTDEDHDHKCDVCQYEYSSHNYDAKNYKYVWNSDYTECTLIRTCSYCVEVTKGHTQSVTTTNITFSITQNVSCDDSEITTYVSNFDGLTSWADHHNDSINVETKSALGHDYSGDWVITEESHYKTCKNQGCQHQSEHISHVDTTEKDHYCDACEYKMSECNDADNDHLCDYCGRRLTYCKDENADQKCDICGTACKDTDKNHICDDCGNVLSKCVDKDKNHVCDYCGETVGEHKRAEGKHQCDYCGFIYNDCEDEDHDHSCDICSKVMSEHSYSDDNISYEWNGDYTIYTAYHTCTYCDENVDGHTQYAYSIKVTSSTKQEQTCTKDEITIYKATFNEDWAEKYNTKGTEVTTNKASGHDWSKDWSYDKLTHWHECENGCKNINNSGAHTYKNGICTVCGCHDVYGSEGLKFNHSKGNYHVIGYTGTDTEVIIPYYYNDGINGFAPVVSIVEAFSNKSITSITIPDSVTAIDDYAFYKCASLKTIIVGNNLTTIGSYAFADCKALETINLGTNLTTIGINAFYNCLNLTAIDLGEKLTFIGSNAFLGCTTLTEFTIPATVTEVGNTILKNCENLKKISYPANLGAIGILFGETTDTYTNNTNNVPSSIKEVVINGGDSLCFGAFYGCSDITTITVCSTVTSIGTYAFKGCNSLQKVEFLGGITEIPADTFSDISALTTIVIPASVTSIGSNAFKNCIYLSEVNLPNGITSIGAGAFSGCTKLTKIVIPSGVTSISKSAFSDCAKLSSIEFKGDLTTIAESAFMNCYMLIDITIPETLTSIGKKAFYGCRNLTEIVIPDGTTSIGEQAFYGCTKLKTFVIPTTVTSLGNNILEECTNITDLTYSFSCVSTLSYLFGSTSYSQLSRICITGGDSIPNDAFKDSDFLQTVEITCEMSSIGNNAFSNCRNLTTLNITGNITNIGSRAFYNCSKLTKAILPSTLTNLGSSAFSNCEKLTEIVIPEGITNINGSTFEFCLSLKTITLPSTLISISNNAFYNCVALESINIPNSVTSIGLHAFYKCNALKYNEYNNACYLGNENNPYVILIKATNTDITSCLINDGTKFIYQEAFKGCTKLNSIEISKNVIYIGMRAFYNCASLESITVSKENQKYTGVGNALVETATKTLILGSEKTVIPTDGGVTSIGDYAFYGNTNLTSIVIPDAITSIGNYAFMKCSSLTNVTFSKNLTSIGDYAFYECDSLESVTLPGSITSLGEGAFGYCPSLTTAIIEKGVTTLGNKSGEGVFQGCESLKSVTLPEELTYIGYQTFRDCTNLESIYYSGTKSEWDNITKESNWNSNVPSSCQVICSEE